MGKLLNESQHETQEAASAADDTSFQLFAGSAEATWTHDPKKAADLSGKALERFVKHFFAA